MIVTQHIPSFIEADAAAKVEVETLDDLLQQRFVEVFQQIAGFKCFSISRYNLPDEVQGLLMAEFSGTPRFWVVAYLSGDISSLAELPEFEPRV